VLLVTKVQPDIHRSGSQVPCIGTIFIRCWSSNTFHH